MVDVQNLRRIAHGGIDLRLVGAGEFQAERHVVVQRHVRIQRVRLEHHRDAAFGGRYVVHARAVDGQIAAADVLEAGDHPHQRRFTATARTHEHDEFAVQDVEVDVAHYFVVVVGFSDVAQSYACHDVS